METYSLLRQFADSWMLLALTLFFVGVIFWAFRPGSAKTHREVAESIFRDDRKPASGGRQGPASHTTPASGGRQGLASHTTKEA